MNATNRTEQIRLRASHQRVDAGQKALAVLDDLQTKASPDNTQPQHQLIAAIQRYIVDMRRADMALLATYQYVEAGKKLSVELENMQKQSKIQEIDVDQLHNLLKVLYNYISEVRRADMAVLAAHRQQAKNRR